MNEPTNDVRERLQETARMISVMLPPNTGFFLLAFDFGPAGGRSEYVSNAQRTDVVRVMREFIWKTELSFEGHQSDAEGDAALLAKLNRLRDIVKHSRPGWYRQMLQELEA